MSDTTFIEYYFKVDPLQPTTDILIAELGELKFDSFAETNEGLRAYIKKKEWREGILDNVRVITSPEFNIVFEVIEIERQNWNALWEQNFEPIKIDRRCRVRAPFHTPAPGVLFDIVIEPKMSFGTGHHETTHMMLQHLLDVDLEGKSVLDMGCGTAVLAILASMKGASRIAAIDNDRWSYLNALENARRNHQPNIEVREGDIALLKDEKYDCILANINRNILLKDIPAYAKHLNPEGSLFLSGFYTEDLPLISAECNGARLSLLEKSEKNNWVAAVYRIS